MDPLNLGNNTLTTPWAGEVPLIKETEIDLRFKRLNDFF